MRRTWGILFTFTTYGTWLRGDRRGWVDDGIVFPANPALEAADVARLKHSPFCFLPRTRPDVGAWMLESLLQRLDVRVHAMTVQSWHVHLVTTAGEADAAEIAKCAKEAVRYGLRPGRPVWTAGYDKRYCFDFAALRARIAYVERHNTEVGLPAAPWPGIVPPQFIQPPANGRGRAAMMSARGAPVDSPGAK